MNIQIGESVTVAHEKRTVTELRRNTEGGIIIIWNSSQSRGGCVPSLWNEWRNGISQEERR